jgi:hypothetical protein
MELLLNVFWLMLSAAAIWWLWCEHAYAQKSRHFGRLHSLLVLACIWALLFPVVSATDDLYAMQAGATEAGLTKRIAKYSAGHKSHALSSGGVGSSPALLTSTCSACARNTNGQVVPRSVFLHEQIRTDAFTSRAPPMSFLS